MQAPAVWEALAWRVLPGRQLWPGRTHRQLSARGPQVYRLRLKGQFPKFLMPPPVSRLPQVAWRDSLSSSVPIFLELQLSSSRFSFEINIFLLFFLHIFYVREWMRCCFFSPQYLICTKQTTISWLFQLCTAHVWSRVDYVLRMRVTAIDYCACVLSFITLAIIFIACFCSCEWYAKFYARQRF